LWDTTTAEELLVLQGSARRIKSVAFSPDGTRLAAASDDRTVHLWDAYTGEELMRLRGHREGLHCVAFSPDGTRLASGAADWTIRLWDAVPYRVRYQERRAVLAAKPEAERIVDALWQDLNDPKLVAQRLREDTSLSDPLRRAALNLLLQKVGRNGP
jgi:hypothetical protein